MSAGGAGGAVGAAGARRAGPGAAATPIRLLSDGPAPGARNMAVDEALMAAARNGRVTLRFYRWDPPCLSFGRHQRARGAYDAEAASARRIDVVRRPTGGRAVYHHRELTYSVTAPADAWGGLRPSYGTINRALARGLAALGVPATLEPGRGAGAPPPSARACFRDPAAGEVAVGGRKLVGSAQWREAGALLQHGSLLLHDDQGVAEGLRVGAADGPRARAPAGAVRGSGASAGASADPGMAAAAGTGAIGLAEVLDPLPDMAELVEALASGFAAELGVPVVPAEPSTAEREAAADLEARYRDRAWTWRR